MVKAVWVGKTFSDQKLVVTPLTEAEEAALPSWVGQTVESVGIAIYNSVGYAKDEQTARENLEW